MNKQNMDLFETLKQLTINNAKVVAEGIYDNDGELEELYYELMIAIDRCENGIGTDDDWRMLIEQTEM